MSKSMYGVTVNAEIGIEFESDLVDQDQVEKEIERQFKNRCNHPFDDDIVSIQVDEFSVDEFTDEDD